MDALCLACRRRVLRAITAITRQHATMAASFACPPNKVQRGSRDHYR